MLIKGKGKKPIIIGDRVQVKSGCYLLSGGGGIRIGNRVHIGSGTKILGAGVTMGYDVQAIKDWIELRIK